MLVFEPTRALKLAPLFWRPKPKPGTPDLLMSLPPELRNRIYAMVVPARQCFVTVEETMQEPEKKKKGKAKPVVETSLLRVSKQIRAEAACVFYGNNTFCMTATLDFERFPECVEMCRDIVKTCGPRPFHKLRINFDGVGAEILTDIVQLLPLLELMRETGFEPDKCFIPENASTLEGKARSVTSGASVFVGVSYSVGEDVLGRAIALGRRARDEQWTKANLDSVFAKFVICAGKRPKRTSRRSKPWPGIF